MSSIRTRIAPSPTGQDLHIGNAYTALINYVFAKKNNGQFLIRIEDTDRTRFVEGSEQRILASLQWLGITHDEGPDIGGPHAPYRQSERLSVYRSHVDTLVTKGHAYYCFCTQDRLAAMREEQEKMHKPPMYDGFCAAIPVDDAKRRAESGEKYVIRLRVPESGTTVCTDTVRGEISFENALIDDQVLLKSDGYPTYHLGVVVDDHLMGISHIIRGEEWISSTPKHVLLYTFFGWELPVFTHVSVLRNPDKSKLSKRKNPVWVSWFKEHGFLPQAVLNYLGTMAWSHPEGKEMFDVAEMMRVFRLEDIQTTAPIFDMEKLRWMNGLYIRSMDENVLAGYLTDFHHEHLTGKPETLLPVIIPLVKERMRTLDEFWSLAGFFYREPDVYEKELDKTHIQLLVDALKNTPWTHAEMESAIRKASEDNGYKARDIFMDLRIAVTGKSVGPPLLESLELLGKQEVLRRLSAAGKN